jgi:hypothetical protein
MTKRPAPAGARQERPVVGPGLRELECLENPLKSMTFSMIGLWAAAVPAASAPDNGQIVVPPKR